MSPLYLPIKKKSVQPPKSTASQADCQHNTENDTPQSKQDALMTQMNGTKRFEDLQSVPLTSVDYPSASCSVMSSAPLTNGATPGFMAPPPARLPPPIAPKAEWTTPEQSRDQSWNCAQDRSCGPWASEREAWGGGKGHAEGQQMWGPNRDRGGPGPQGGSAGGPGPGGGPEGRPGGGPEGGWSTGRDWCQGPGREEGWREQTWSNSTPVSNNGSNTVAPSAAHPSTDPKPTAVPVKKELPVYPPGSEEEQWQLQIMAKGRVTCPKCKSVSRKTVEGLKKHMDNCRLEPFSCPHCGKQLKSSTGMKYHIMADHSLLPSSDAKDLDDRAVKEKLRKILKRLGKLKCSQQGCSAAFTSIMGYFYHMRKCGKEQSELEKMALSCVHCGKSYRSKAGLEYHLRTEHAPVTVKTEAEEVQAPPLGEQTPERTACGRVQRASAQVANLQLAHIAHNELPKDWSKRKFQSDLVPDDKKLKYSRPGLPAFSQEVLRKWKNEVKLHRKVHCPNKGCGSVYTSVSGLKAHLGLCTKGEFEAGKYRCLICNKEFNSESGVKYHINSVHSQDWFVTNKKACKKFEKLLKTQPKDFPPISDPRLSQDFLQQQQQQQQHQQQQHFQHYPPPPHHQHHHHHHVPPPHQLQPPPQPLHHLQPQKHLLYPENQPLPPHPDPRMHQQQPPVHYTPLQPVWVERRAEKHQQDVRNMNRTRDGGGAERSGFEFEGVRGDNGSREMEDEMQRQMWDQKRQMLESVDVVKRQEST